MRGESLHADFIEIVQQCANTREDLNGAILLLIANWRHYDDSVLLSPDLVVGFWEDKAVWLITLDAASAQMTNAPFLLNTIPKHLLWIVDQTYVICKMSMLKSATAGDQASLHALQQKPQPVPQQPAPQLQYEGPPKDMLSGPRGHAPITAAPKKSRRNAVSATHTGPSNLERRSRASLSKPANFCKCSRSFWNILSPSWNKTD